MMKQTNIFRLFTAAALTAVLSLGSAMSVFAAGPITGGSETTPAKVAIDKVLQMPEGTITPNADFIFQVAKVKIDGSTVQADLNTMPDVPDGTVSTVNSDSGTTTAGVKTVTKPIPDIFNGVSWPHAGIYVYEITEQPDTYTPSPMRPAEQMEYSQAKYQVEVFVKDGTSGTYISDIVVLDKTPDASGNPPAVDVKVDKMTFTNTYLKQNGGPHPVDSAYEISKVVAGSLADRTKYFTYTLTLQTPAVQPAAASTVYKAYVLDDANLVVTSEDNADAAYIATDGYGKYINIQAGTPITIKLKHNQRLSFTDIPVGASYIVEEAAAQNYTPSVVITAGTATNSISGGANSSLSTGNSPILITETTNRAAFTNTYAEVTPTGIVMDNLPFVVMILLAIAALVGYLIVKSRKKVQQGYRL